MRDRRCFQCVALLLPLLIAVLSGGCARQPPNSGTGNQSLSGKKIRVTLTFATTVNPLYLYYFVINMADNKGNPEPGGPGEQNAPGPIAVFTPISGQPYVSNGFATSSSPGVNGFSDFVLFSSPINQYKGNQQASGYSLYHVPSTADSNDRTKFQPNGGPLNPVVPGDPTQPSSAVLQFDIDMSQLVFDSMGNTLDATQTITDAKAIRFLQVNVIATNLAPTNPQQFVSKQVDSLGDTQTQTGQTSYLTIDLSQIGKTYQNSDYNGQNIFEPTDHSDVVGAANPDAALDLRNWSIQVIQQ